MADEDSMKKIVDSYPHMELKKNVAAIHTSSKLTLVQHKLADFLLFNAYPTLLDKEVHEIELKVIKSYLEYNSNNNDFLKSSLEALKTYPIRWNVLDKTTNEEEWVTSSIISEARIKGGKVSYSYGPFLRQRLADPEIYALLDLRVQQKLKTEHSVKLWESCYRFHNVGSTGFHTVATWKELLLADDPTKAYPQFKDFKRYVLEPAINQVNQFSNIHIEPEYKKEAGTKKISEIRFIVSNSDIVETDAVESTQVPDVEILKILEDEFGITSKKAFKVCASFDPKIIREKIDAARAMKGNKKIRSIGGYLIRSIELDYQVTRIKTPKSSSSPKPKVEKEVQAAGDFNKRFNTFKTKYASDLVENMSDDERKPLEAAFIAQANPTYKVMYRENGMDSKILKLNFISYIADNYVSKETLILKFAEANGL